MEASKDSYSVKIEKEGNEFIVAFPKTSDTPIRMEMALKCKVKDLKYKHFVVFDEQKIKEKSAQGLIDDE